MKKLLVLLGLTVALAVPGMSAAKARQAPPVQLPDRIDLPDGWMPEGITAGRYSNLYVGSIPTGAIQKVNARTGATRTLVAPQTGRAAIGLKYDTRERLFVAGGPTGKGFVYNARTGADVRDIQLAAAGDADTFVNDVALTRRTAYFTDSRKSQIYAVSTSTYAPRTIALPDIPDEPGNNLNGIVATPSGDALLAIQSSTGRLWKIDPATGRSAPVELGGTVLNNSDGLLLNGQTLYVVQNRLNQIAVVRLNATYTAGRVASRIAISGADVPTTITFLRGELYAVNARFGTTDPQPADYWVTLVRR